MSKTFDTLIAEQIDKKFDDGEDVLEYFDLENPQVNSPLRSIEQKRVTLTMPEWMIQGLDKQAADLAISRNAVINTYLAERLTEQAAS
ncbi:type II toxin-antitoxin system BrnA family antitoxin [Varibaculum massiliense]|uniref:type II toxin-antitoxin system BrnA family antitoxin n=1 Tax=Varibaculum massiliense TaxID=1852372 RepID=UPI0008D8F7EA|nr:antitoxin [Varibaculum massiliense]